MIRVCGRCGRSVVNDVVLLHCVGCGALLCAACVETHAPGCDEAWRRAVAGTV